MKYEHIVIPRFGGPDNLSLVEEELLEPRANEVRVRVLAAGVSFADENESGVGAVFNGIGGKSLQSSYEILRSGGRLFAYGGTPTTDLEDWLKMFTSNLVLDKREFILYSIQTLKRLKPVWLHEDLILLLNLLEQGKIKPIITAKMPLNQAAQAHELLAGGSVTGKIMLICND